MLFSFLTAAAKSVWNRGAIAIARIFVRLLEDFSRDRKENVIYRVHVSSTEHAQC